MDKWCRAKEKTMRDKIKQMEKVRSKRSTEPGDDEEEETGGVLTGGAFGCSKMFFVPVRV